MPRHGARSRRGNLGDEKAVMNSTLKSLLFWLVIVVIGAAIWQFSSLQRSDTRISFTQFVDKAKLQQVLSVTFRGNQITGKFKDDPTKGFYTVVPSCQGCGYEGLSKLLSDSEVQVEAEDT